MAITLLERNVSTTATAATGELSPGFFVSDADERALRLIGGWLDESSRRAVAGETVSAELTAHFYAWLDDPRERRAKERALDIIMEGCLDDSLHDDSLHDDLSDDIHDDIHDDMYTIFNIHSY